MPATALPSSGDEPGRTPGRAPGREPGRTPGTPGPAPGTAKTCDASGMAEIHRFFRAGFGEGRALVAGVAESDAAHADVVCDHLELLSVGLHAHHEGEDTMLWGTLETRAPSCAVHVARMKEQHAALLVHLNELDAALPAWRASGRSADAAGVLFALDGITAALAAHLPDEEANIVPVMEVTLTPKEVDALSEHGRKATPKGKTFEQLGAILAAQPDGGVEWQRAHLPGPVRLIWRLIGKPKYEANRAALTGHARR
ncbi:hemerythrin domain-containing protein [Agromyces badenianii]|uniref:hemerythrin domain-containing protein n=1 Tax=Agromyces badenianii TaxID=2080742 RepID=UPI000D59094E|nr:hemerythrin domain-containing protein [Agromyces badenianii]PWC05898.1 hemerythrin domain-containing protein [Agromyces badenianii]